MPAIFRPPLTRTVPAFTVSSLMSNPEGAPTGAGKEAGFGRHEPGRQRPAANPPAKVVRLAQQGRTEERITVEA